MLREEAFHLAAGVVPMRRWVDRRGQGRAASSPCEDAAEDAQQVGAARPRDVRRRARRRHQRALRPQADEERRGAGAVLRGGREAGPRPQPALFCAPDVENLDHGEAEALLDRLLAEGESGRGECSRPRTSCTCRTPTSSAAAASPPSAWWASRRRDLHRAPGLPPAPVRDAPRVLPRQPRLQGLRRAADPGARRDAHARGRHRPACRPCAASAAPAPARSRCAGWSTSPRRSPPAAGSRPPDRSNLACMPSSREA